jgi:hypothetical protein
MSFGRPMICVLYISRSILTTSNAALRSRLATATYMSLSIALAISICSLRAAVTVLLPFLKPCCLSVKRSPDSAKVSIRFKTHFSKIFDAAHRFDIGL